MEQHAVPQDITGFRFKLVGDMTLKQFGELAGGAIVAYLFYASGLHPFLKWPLVFLFVVSGFALAFLPVEERPLDVWIINFLRAIYQPTVYIWEKSPALVFPAAPITSGPIPSSRPASRAPAHTPVAFPVAAAPKPPAEEPKAPPPAAPNEPLSVDQLQQIREEKLTELNVVTKKLEKMTVQLKGDIYKAEKGPEIVTVDHLAHIRDEKKERDEAQLRDLIEQNKRLNTQIETVKTRIQSLAGMDTTQLQAQLNTLSQQKETLDTAISQLQAQMEKSKTAPSEPPPPPPSEAQIKVVAKPVTKQTTISLTEVPNVINGLVASDRNMPLDNTIMVIKDAAGNSIRALKTNRVGQFVVSTPLENGIYYLEFERPNYTFDVLEITLEGKVLAPIQVTGRGQNEPG